MDGRNQSVFNEFVLLGFSKDLKINIALFVLFLIIYLITIIGNGLIIGTILLNSHLHIPMYFFLCNLSLIDFCYSSTSVPRLLSDLFSVRRTISYFACFIQLFIVVFVGGTECQLLALMAYDRFVAICRPLHYHHLMKWRVCYCLTAFVWFFSFMIIIVPALATPPKLCDQNQINHFMCEVLAVIKLSFSYAYIISSVLKIHSAGQYKAFSTCTSHAVVVFLFFGTGMLTYFGPRSQYSSNQNKYVSVFYVIVCPMLNPLIYSLSNREIRKAHLRVSLRRENHCSRGFWKVPGATYKRKVREEKGHSAGLQHSKLFSVIVPECCCVGIKP
ncbi:PREDICTED: olfactory receptor 2B6-like [Nanorana parkeri]|uniref:olfactory receptor 2B6-like n=1 Tax=Nanorana parkeri TaxID=125878 RepID=UPI0008548AD7|nr:PREDICTED: olfactory receptor 2B6-like [Nanorana parkeri]